MKNSTKNKAQGTAREVKGKVKEEAGDLVDNERLEERGRDEKLAGRVQRKVGEIQKVIGK